MFPQISNRSKVIVGMAVILLAIGAAIGYWAFSPKPPVIQTYHPAEVLAPGVIMAEVKPDPNAKPAVEIPKGYKTDRIIKASFHVKVPTVDIGGSVEVQNIVTKMQDAVKSAQSGAPMEEVKEKIMAACPQAECPEAKMELTLVHDEAGQQRAILKVNGDQVQAVDIPVVNAAPPPKPRNWGAGLSFDPLNRTLGGIIERRIHEILPLTLGAELNQTQEGRVDKLSPRVFLLYNF